MTTGYHSTVFRYKATFTLRKLHSLGWGGGCLKYLLCMLAEASGSKCALYPSRHIEVLKHSFMEAKVSSKKLFCNPPDYTWNVLDSI